MATEPAGPAARPAPPAWIRVAAAATAVLMGLAMTEGLARLVTPRYQAVQAEYIGWAAEDPKLGWRNRAGVFKASEGTHQLMTMLPDGSRTAGSPPGVGPEVVLVGCSFVCGYGVRDDETLAWRLQERFPNLRFRNYGTPGYGTYQSLLLLQELVEAKRERPLLVIYGFVPFHADRNVLTGTMTEAFRFFGGRRFSPPRIEVQGGQLLPMPPSFEESWPLEGHSALVTLTHKVAVHTSLAGRERYREEATNLLLSRMKEVTERSGGRFLTATLWDGGSEWSRSYKEMSAGMRASGVEELDLTYRGPETRPERLLVQLNGHPSALIDAWWADKLESWLEEQRLGQ